MENGTNGWSGKRVLVTGGTTGIGRAITKTLADEGAQILIFGREKAHLEDALAAMQGCPGEVHGLNADQANVDDIDRVFAEVESKLGGLDVLINNAAIASETVHQLGEEETDYALRSNLLGYVHCSRKAIPMMEQNHGGDIVNIGSISAVEKGKGSDVYVATKGGIAAFSESLRKELAEADIRVLLIEPGLVGTDMTLEKASPEEQRKKIEKGEMLAAEDIAACVKFVLEQPRRCSMNHVRIQPRLEIA